MHPYIATNQRKKVYMEAPIVDLYFGLNKVCRLKRKPLIHIKASPQAWFERFTSAMKKMAFKQS